jgi:hypothetical protein
LPTPEQLTQVQTNATNIINLSNHLHDFLQDAVNEVYGELSADQGVDSGYEFLCTVLETVFAVAELVEFPGAAFAGAFLPLLFSASSPKGPDEIRSELGFKEAATWARLGQTFLNVDLELAEIHDDPAGHWDKTFTSPVTGKETPVSSLGDPGVKMPAFDEVPFQRLTDAVIAQFRLDLTKSLLPSLYYSYYSNYYSNWQYGTAEDFFKSASDYIANWPPYFFKYRPVIVRKGGTNYNAIQYYNFSLVREGSTTSTASNEMCKWLFEDDGYGHPSGYKGFAGRAAVFFSWGLRQYYADTPDGGPPFGLGQAVTSFSTAAAAVGSEELVLDGEPGEGHEPGPLPGPQA